jgi:hypothetical protein
MNRCAHCALLLLRRLARIGQLRDIRQICQRRLAILLVILDDCRLSRLTRNPGHWLGSGCRLLPLLVAEDRVVIAGDGAGGARSFGGGGLSGETLALETHFAAALVAVPEDKEQDFIMLVFV